MTLRFLARLLHAISLLALLAAPGFAQLVLKNGGDIVGPSLTLPSVTPGDTLDTLLTLTNTGASTITVSKLALGGSAFSLRDYPALPKVLGPGESLTFTLRFAPTQVASYSASVIAGTVSFFVLAKTTYGPTLYYADASGALQPVIDTLGVDLGPVQRGLQITRKFTLQNNNLQTVTVNRLSIAGDFRLAQVISAPFTLASGQPTSFNVISIPGAGTSGILSGTLFVDAKTVSLRGQLVAPVLPKPSIGFSSTDVNSSTQTDVTINLDAPAPSAATGTLELILQNGPVGAAPDSGMIFPATGAASATFTVAAGESVGRFAGKPSITVQTGTTAGDLLFTAKLGDTQSTATLSIAKSAVALTTVHATRTGTGLQVELVGFDNTRTVGSIAFTFYDVVGHPLGSTYTVNLLSNFQTYFQSSTVGGIFDLKAVFPVTSGSVNVVDTVDIRIANSVSATSAPRAKF